LSNYFDLLFQSCCVKVSEDGPLYSQQQKDTSGSVHFSDVKIMHKFMVVIVCSDVN